MAIPETDSRERVESNNQYTAVTATSGESLGQSPRINYQYSSEESSNSFSYDIGVNRESLAHHLTNETNTNAVPQQSVYAKYEEQTATGAESNKTSETGNNEATSREIFESVQEWVRRTYGKDGLIKMGLLSPEEGGEEAKAEANADTETDDHSEEEQATVAYEATETKAEKDPFTQRVGRVAGRLSIKATKVTSAFSTAPFREPVETTTESPEEVTHRTLPERVHSSRVAKTAAVLAITGTLGAGTQVNKMLSDSELEGSTSVNVEAVEYMSQMEEDATLSAKAEEAATEESMNEQQANGNESAESSSSLVDLSEKYDLPAGHLQRTETIYQVKAMSGEKTDNSWVISENILRDHCGRDPFNSEVNKLTKMLNKDTLQEGELLHIKVEHLENICDVTLGESPQERRTALMDYLIEDFELTPEQASGVVGNFMVESGGADLPPNVNEYLPSGGGTGAPRQITPGQNTGGYGWAQWTGGRKERFINWAIENGYMSSWEDTANDAANIGFLRHELSGPESAALDYLKQTDTPQEAADVFMNKFERPGVPHASKRELAASQAFNEYKNRSTPEPESTLEPKPDTEPGVEDTEVAVNTETETTENQQKETNSQSGEKPQQESTEEHPEVLNDKDVALEINKDITDSLGNVLRFESTTSGNETEDEENTKGEEVADKTDKSENHTAEEPKPEDAQEQKEQQSEQEAEQASTSQPEPKSKPESEPKQEQKAEQKPANRQEYAQHILRSGNVTGDPRYMEQIEAIANGDTSCNINHYVLGALAEISNHHEVYITSLNRNCTGVLTKSGKASSHYKAGGGHAFDIGRVDGVKSTGNTDKDRELLQMIDEYLPAGSAIGQINCREVPLLIPEDTRRNLRFITDSCDHIHIEVPTEVPVQ